MKLRNLALGVAAGMALICAAGVSAATITSADGVLSIDTPADNWTKRDDPASLLTITDGQNSISINHLSNGEALPVMTVADESHPDVYMALISNKNEVFSVKGLAGQNSDLQTLIQTIGTIKILKFDTKTAVKPVADSAKQQNQQTQQNQQSQQQSGANVTPAPAAEDGDSIHLYAEDGSEVTVYFDKNTNQYVDTKGLVYLPMAGALMYEPMNGTYWNGDPSYWNDHSSEDLDYDEFEKHTTINDDEGEDTFTVYAEDGSYVNITYYPSTGQYEDFNGLVYLPMAGALYYEPVNGTYWDADPDFWNNNSSENLDYDEFEENMEDDAEETYDDDDDYDDYDDDGDYVGDDYDDDMDYDFD